MVECFVGHVQMVRSGKHSKNQCTADFYDGLDYFCSHIIRHKNATNENLNHQESITDKRDQSTGRQTLTCPDNSP